MIERLPQPCSEIGELLYRHPLDPKERRERVIWMYWHTNLAQAPEVVRWSYESWRALNPGYRVEFLDRARLAQVVGFDFEKIFASLTVRLGRAGRSDLMRLYLIHRFGGCWADATTFCLRPIDQWLDISATGFFCFRQPQTCPDRQICSWFLAARQGSPLVRRWLLEAINYLTADRDRRLSIGETGKEATPGSHVSRAGTGYSFLAAQEYLEIAPYFWLFYLFNEVSALPEFCDLWSEIERQPNAYVQPNADYQLFSNAFVSKQSYRAEQSKRVLGERIDHLRELIEKHRGETLLNNW